MRRLLIVLGFLLGIALIGEPLTATAQTGGKTIKMEVKSEKLTTSLKRLERVSGYKILFSYDDLSRFTVSGKTINTKSIRQALDILLAGTPLKYEVDGQFVNVYLSEGAVRTAQQKADGQSQQNVIRGHVRDIHGEPVVGAVVRDHANKVHAVTDMDGNFTLTAKSDKAQLTISYLGMKTATVTCRKGSFAHVTMEDEATRIDDVVVTGYQVLDKRSLTSAVTSVNMDELQRADVSSLDQMLEGRIADLMVTNVSGEIGVAPKIRIRGTSTLIGNREPLWVVDGIVMNDPVEIAPEELNDPDYVNRIGNAIAGINPQDIERIDVLKDAAATAIYGTKAANGVIVVTTKRGFEGKPQVSYTMNVNMKLRPRYTDRSVDVMTSKERIQFSRELYHDHYEYPYRMAAVGYEGLLTQMFAGNLTYNQFVDEVGKAEGRNTDWFDLLLRDSWSTSHNASVSGGSERSRYYASIGYNKDSDVIKANNNERYTFALNIDNTFSKLLTVSFSFNGYHYKRNGYQESLSPLQYAYQANRAIPAYDDNGEYYFYEKKSSDGYEYSFNILNEMANSSRKQVTNSMTFNTNLRFTFTDWLHANAILSVTHQNADLEGWWGEKTQHIAMLRKGNYGEPIEYPETSTCPQGGELSKTTTRDRAYTLRFQLDANKYFGENDKHNIDASLGLEINSDKYKSYGNVSRGYFKDRGESFVTDIDPTMYPSYATWLSGNQPTIIDNLTNTVSTYLSLTYAYNRIWRVNLNGRLDGSNKFGDRSNDKFLPIWSLSGSYDVGHWIKAPWIDYITAKASYGFQGNMLDTENPLMAIRKGSMSSYFGEYTSTIEQRPNPDLKWEKTNSVNIGLDMSLFSHRLEMEVSLFYKKTVDAFMNKKVSSVNGTTNYVINGGDVTNKGYSFDITATPILTKDFRWTLSTSISKIINSIDSRPDAQTYDLEDFLSGSTLVEGKSVNTFYSYHFLGLSPVDGGPLIDDYSDSPDLFRGKSKYDAFTTLLTASGKREADIQGSLTNTFRYKNWRANVTLGYSLGAKTRLFAMYGSAASGGAYGTDIYSEKNYSRDYMKRWQKPGDELHTNIPAIISNNNSAYFKYSRPWWDMQFDVVNMGDNYWDMYDYSDIRVVSADYLKLQSASITYEFDQKLLSKIGMQRIALTASCYNLFTICDPDLKGQTPTQGGFSTIQLSDRPSFSLGVNVIF